MSGVKQGRSEWARVSQLLHPRTSDASVHALAPAESKISPKFRKTRSTTSESSLRLLHLEPLETPRHNALLLLNVVAAGGPFYLIWESANCLSNINDKLKSECRKPSLWRALPLTAKETSTHACPTSSFQFAIIFCFKVCTYSLAMSAHQI